jgi:D-alanyl-D-alanine carboxypeptidase
MRKIVYVSMFFFLAFSRPVAAQVPPALETEFQQIIEAVLVDPGVKGIAACIIMPDNSVWTGQAGGNGSGTGITDTTVFYGGSTTKTFVATRILQLWEDGLINLDTTYTAYLDTIAFVLPETTIRQLLSHTSGVFDYDENPFYFIDLYYNPAQFYTPAGILQKWVNQPHVFAPGTAYAYSNTNYVILGMVVEAITGNPLAEELRNHVYNQVPVYHTYFGAYESFTEPYCGLWMLDGSTLVDYTYYPHTALLSSAYAAGNIVTHPLDEALFIRHLINGNILSGAALSEMLTLNPFSNDYGLGIIGIEFAQDTLLYGHNGGIGNLTDMFHCPQLNLTVVVMQNSENGTTAVFNNLFVSAWQAIVASVEEPLPATAGFTIFPNPAHDYVNISLPAVDPNTSVEICSLSGEVVERLTPGDAVVQADISHYRAGCYFVLLRSGERTVRLRFIKL